jgi:tryptophan halogenase
MAEVGATYKSAIRFVDWSRRGTEDNTYWHPFASRPEPSVLPFESPYFPEVGTRVSLLHYALKRRLQGNRRSIAEQLTSTVDLCHANRSPVHPDRPDLSVSYAYHFDAGLLARFLKEHCLSRGVRHKVGHVDHVEVNDRGFVESVRTTDHEDLAADLFLDCTGFRSMLLGKALGVEFRDDSNLLLCDSAVAIGCDNDPENQGIPPYTTSTALTHGWVWDVPLMHRNGCGYVYSSRFASKEEAEAELRSFLGPRCKAHEARHIRMRVGRMKQFWHKNCVGVGLSSSFIEPLESTGIFLIEYGLATLLTLFPSLQFSPGRVAKYNEVMSEMYDDTRDFILMHYLLSDRDDSEFWRAARSVPTPTSLERKLQLFESNLPVLDELMLRIFPAFSYACILDGNDHLPRQSYPLLEHVGYDLGERALNDIEAATSDAVREMPAHYDYLLQMQERK